MGLVCCQLELQTDAGAWSKDVCSDILCLLPQVLRFYCIWDDRQRLFGDRQPFRLHYFLEDDTVEILEEPQSNSGRDAFPIFLRRTPLPKVCPACLLFVTVAVSSVEALMPQVALSCMSIDPRHPSARPVSWGCPRVPVSSHIAQARGHTTFSDSQPCVAEDLCLQLTLWH